MSKTYIADKETLDSVKTDTGAILENLSSAGVVKSMQTGEIQYNTSDSVYENVGGYNGKNYYGYGVDITINSVDITRSEVRVSSLGSSVGSTWSPMAYLVNETTLRVLHRFISVSGDPNSNKGHSTSYTHWEVVEYN